MNTAVFGHRGTLKSPCFYIFVVLMSVFALLSMAEVCIAQPAVIPLRAKTKIFQPGEQVILCFNGRKETIVIRQYLRSSRFTEAMRIIPFPSNVSFGSANFSIFARMKRIVKSKHVTLKNPITRSSTRKKTKQFQFFVSDRYLSKPREATVLRISKLDFLINLITSKVPTTGEFTPAIATITEKTKAMFASYLENDFKYFYVDRLKIRPKTRGIAPTRFSFRTSLLYYPFKLSRFFSQSGDIVVYLVYKKGLFSGKKISFPGTRWMASDRYLLSREEVGKIDPEIASLFQSGKIELQLFRYRGRLSSFSSDLLTLPGENP